MTDARIKIDAYIAKAQPFAIPVLNALRRRVHAAVPDAVEAIKWGMPHFTHKGKILCHMGAFKAHVVVGFMYGDLVLGNRENRMAAMGDLGKITSLADLPDEKAFADWVIKSRDLIEQGAKPPHFEGRGKHPKPEIAMVAELAEALARDGKAKATWDAFSPGSRRDYLEWITGAKREETRCKRIATTVTQLAEGKKLNWKYEKC